jgi:hypothetical protein
MEGGKQPPSSCLTTKRRRVTHERPVAQRGLVTEIIGPSVRPQAEDINTLPHVFYPVLLTHKTLLHILSHQKRKFLSMTKAARKYFWRS